MKLWIYNLILLSFFFISCSLDIPEKDDYLRWTTNLEIPLGEQKIHLGSLSDDSDISVKPLDDFFKDGTSDDSIFLYQKVVDIQSIKVGNKLEIDPISTSFTQSVDDVTISEVEELITSNIGIISLNNIASSDVSPFIFRDIYPEVENIENGTSTSIPAFELTPITNPFSFSDFGDAEFSSGHLKVTINNGMIIPLGTPIVLQLQALDGADTVNISGGTLEFDTLINANGGNVTDSLDLTGMTLPGDIFVKVSGSCQGTSGIAVNIDEDAKNSSFIVSISAENLEVVSAIAKIPEQLIEESGVISLEPDSNKVTRAVIQNGKLNIEVHNYMSLESNLIITIPSIENPDGTLFETTLNIQSNSLNINSENNLENHVLVMSENSQEINYNYSIMTVDSGDELVPINSEDSIIVSISMGGLNQNEDISFSQFQGFLDQDAMIDSNIIELETESKIDFATLQSGYLELSIINGIGVEALIDFSINELKKENQKLDTSFTLPIGEPLMVKIDLEEYELNINLETDPQIINYISRINIPSNEEMTLTFGQNIEIEVLLDSLLFSDFSGFIDPIDIEIDSVKQTLDLPSELENLNFSELQLNFSFFSNIDIPVLLNLELFSINDETGETFSRTVSDINIIETPEFTVEDVQGLINIKPNSILAFGTAQVGSLEQYGSVSTEDTLAGSFKILAPLAFTIDSGSEIKLEPEPLDSLNIVDEIENVTIFIDYKNDFEFGVDAIVLVSQDTNDFNNGLADTLTQITIQPDSSSLDSISLDQTSFELLSLYDNYSKTNLVILGRDEEPSRFLSTDTLNMKLYMKTKVIIDPASDYGK